MVESVEKGGRPKKERNGKNYKLFSDIKLQLGLD